MEMRDMTELYFEIRMVVIRMTKMILITMGTQTEMEMTGKRERNIQIKITKCLLNALNRAWWVLPEDSHSTPPQSAENGRGGLSGSANSIRHLHGGAGAV